MKKFVLLVFCLFAFPILSHSADGELLLGGGLVNPEFLKINPSLMAAYEFNLPHHFTVGPEITYWQFDDNINECLGLRCSSGFMKRSDFTIAFNSGLSVPYRNFSFSLGTGLGYHFLRQRDHISVSGLGRVDHEDTLTKVGLHLLGGVQYDLSSKVGLFFSERYEWIHESDNAMKTYGGLVVHF